MIDNSDQLDVIRDAIIDGQADAAEASITIALANGIPAASILNDGLIAAMGEVGQMYEEGECFVPEMLTAARAMKSGLEVLKPHLAATGVESRGKVAIGAVEGDLHDIGKSLVAMMLEGSGFEIIDLGINVPPEKFVDAIQKGAQVVAISALLTTTMGNMKRTIEVIEESGLRDGVIVMVGGAPVTDAFASQIGADGYAPDASSAVRILQDLMDS